MLYAIVKKKIESLEYNIDDLIPIYSGNKGRYFWHVATKVVPIPKDSISLDLSVLNKP